MASASRREVEPNHAELDLVRLRSMLYTDDEGIPAGPLGTIVFRHDRGAAYEVEFIEPFAAGRGTCVLPI